MLFARNCALRIVMFSIAWCRLCAAGRRSRAVAARLLLSATTSHNTQIMNTHVNIELMSKS